MTVTIDLEQECLKDSPRFRAALKEVDGEVTELEVKLDKLVQLCVGMIDAGKAFCAANKQFMNGIRDLAQYLSKDVLIESSLTKFSDGLQEVINYHTILFDQAQRSIKIQLQIFIKDDLRKFKDAKKQFDKVSKEKENALVKNARVKRTKLHEVEEATNILIVKQKRFRHIALDNVLQINALQSKQRSEILKSMLSFMYAHLGFFHLGFNLFSELEPVMKELGTQLDGLVVDAAKEKRDMEQKHCTIQQKDFTDDDLRLEEANGIVIEGYLFKRTSNTFKTWNRCWFSIQNNQLAYQKKMKDSPTVVVEDVRLCTVKHREDIARRFCFEVVSPTKSCMLQADSEKLRQAWVKAVQTSIATAYSEKSDETEKLDKTSSPSTGSLDSGSEVKEELFEGASIATAYSEKSDERENLDKTSSPSTGSLDSGSEVKEELFEGASIAKAYSEKSDETENLDKTSSPSTGSLDSGSEVKEELFEGASIATAYSEKSDETEKLDKTSSPSTGSLDSGSEVKEELFEGASIATAYSEKSDEMEKLDKTSSPSTGSLDFGSEVEEELFEDASIATAYSEKSDEMEKLDKTSSPSIGSLDSGSQVKEELFEGASIATAYSEKSDETEKLDKTSSPSTGSLDSGSDVKEELFEGEIELQLIQCIAGNSVCCDCGLADPPWASINLGIILCIECAGIHRSLGVHFSKVRSLTLDTWEPELLMLMLELGNQVINQIYEAKLKTLGVKKPDKESPRLEKEEYIRAKYVEKRFVNQDCVASHPLGGQKWPYSECRNEDPNSSEKSLASQDHFSTSSRSSVESNNSEIHFSSDGRRELLASTVSSNSLYEPVLEVEKRDSSVFQYSEKFHPGLHLYRAAYEESLPDMTEALAHGADVNWVNEEENNATPLIQAVHGGSLVACEFLLQNGANVNHMDLCGRGPLHHATVLGHTGQVCLFLKRWANQHTIDEEGKDPLTIAVEAANTDIVTLLRGARMNEEKLDKTSSPSTGSLDSGSEVKEELFEGASIATAYSEKSDETEKLDKTSSPSTGSLDSGSEVKEELFEGASIATAYSEKSDETEKLDKTSSPSTGSLDSGSEVKEELFEGASIATAYSEKSDEMEKLDKTSSSSTGSLDSGSEVKEELFEGASIATAYSEKSDEMEKLDKTSSPSTGSLDSGSEVKEELFEGANIATAYSEKSDETEKLDKTSSPSTGSLDSGSEVKEELFEGASIATAYSEKSDETEKLDKTSSPSTGSLDSGSEVKEELFEGEIELQLIQCIAGNSVCCDCGLADPPWASINLGIVLCIECAGIHRSLGVHFSKVRSLTLDTWEPELLMLMLELGNQVINQIYEAKLKTLGVKKPDKESPRLEKEEYIRAKYVEKRFVNQDCVASHPLGGQKWPYSERKNEDPNSSEKSLASQDHFSTSSRSSVESNNSEIHFSSDGRRELLASTVSSNSSYEPVLEVEKRDSSVFQDSEKFNPGLHLYRAAYEESLPDMAEALAHGADVNWVNEEENNATPLIQAVHGGSLVACEFLLQNGANVNHMDLCGRGPLHHATVLGHTGQVCLFLKRWANHHAIDEEGKDPLTIAVEAANTDIVTLLRGARMNEEMRESEGLYGQPGDETYQDILCDFSHLATNYPEKLNLFQPSDTPKS